MPGALVHELLEAPCTRAPGRRAVVDGRGALDRGELHGLAGRWATWLRQQGVRRGDRVVVLAENDAATAALLFAASYVGAVLVPLHPATPSGLVRHIVDDVAPRLVLAPRDPGVVHVPLSAAELSLPAVDRPPSQPDSTDADPLLIIYTSGSTSRPKGVVCSHRSVVFAARAIAARLDYRPADVVFCCLPLSFDYGLYQILLTTIAGCTLVLAHPDAAGPSLLADIESSGATVVPVVPSLAQNLLRLAARRPSAGGSIRLLTNTGAELTAPARAALRRAFPTASIVTMFGLTECKRVTISDPDEDLRHPGSVGRALPGTEIRVVDDRGRPLPPGQVGELVVRGPHVMLGYWQAPEVTAQRFRRSPETGEVELVTGDFGTLDHAGRFRWVGRRDDQYKQRGCRVSGTELESAARTVAGVEEVAVLPPTGSHEAVLVVAGTCTRAELVAGLGQLVEPAKLPPHLHVVDRMPLTANGKVDRGALAGRLR